MEDVGVRPGRHRQGRGGLGGEGGRGAGGIGSRRCGGHGGHQRNASDVVWQQDGMPHGAPGRGRKQRRLGSRKIYLGVGGGGRLGAPFPSPPPPPRRGLQGPALCFPWFSCIFQIIGFSYHVAKLPCHLLEPLVNCRIPLTKLEMQAQTSARPVTMLVSICHTRGEQTAALRWRQDFRHLY